MVEKCKVVGIEKEVRFKFRDGKNFEADYLYVVWDQDDTQQTNLFQGRKCEKVRCPIYFIDRNQINVGEHLGLDFNRRKEVVYVDHIK